MLEVGFGFSFPWLACWLCVKASVVECVEVGVGFLAWRVEGRPVGSVERALALGGVGEESLEGRDGGGVDDVLW